MNDIVIKAENLGKKYIIGHQAGNGRYVALRDEVMRNARSLWHKTKDLVQGKPIIQGDTLEEMWALKDLSFEIQRGQAVGIIGRNGAGKSTLLKILSRITEPSTERVAIKGRVASLLEVGTGFHPELTGRENIFLNGAILGMTRQEIRRKFDEIVSFAEVEKYLDTPVKRYSSGMYVRLAFAVAAHLEPEILLVDEVLAVGDAEFQKKCLGKMSKVAYEGRTVMFVSHNMPSIQALCQRVLLIQEGRMKDQSKPDEVISQYLSQRVDVESAEVDLSNCERDSRSKQRALRRAWIINGDGQKSNLTRMGEDLTLYYEYHCSRPIVNPGFGFVVEDEHGKPIFSLNNYTVASSQNTLKTTTSGIARLHIPSLPLLPATYFVTFDLVEDVREWVDCADRALAIHVEPADIYGSGKIPHGTLGVVFIPGDILVMSEGQAFDGSSQGQ